jgi:glycosyltransferase involved in cell wall biosynthesis
VRPPDICVVVPTRNRSEQAIACARAILVCAGPSFEALFVDQSDSAETGRRLKELEDPRLRHVASRRRGISAGRNVGIALSRAPLVAFTDDDCRVPPGWLARIADHFAAEPGTSVLFGRVGVPEDLPADAFAASFEAEIEDCKADLSGGFRSFGIGANFAARRGALQRVGPFDEALGAGTALEAGEEFDFIFRALACGLVVRNVRDVELIHLGVRRGREVDKLRLGYVRGTAACLAKHARLGDSAVRRFLLRLTRDYVHGVFEAARLRRRPLGLRWLGAHALGLAAAYTYAVDRDPRLFIDRRTGAPVRGQSPA